jgi:hypothetical protein
MKGPVLTQGDIQSSCWARLVEYYKERLESLRAQNDNSTLTPEATADLRGRIKEVKDLLALATPAPVTAVNPVD